MPGTSSPGRLLRVAAGLTVLLGLLLLDVQPVLAGQAGYLGVLTGLGAGMCILSGLRMWFVGCCVARTLAVAVSLFTLASLVLDRYVGLPGSTVPDRSWDLPAVAVLVLAPTLVVMLLIDTRSRVAGASQTSPYALLP